jgi:type II secretory pathway predicted ATPase ExeA
MFLEFYKLKEQPFGVTPDPRFLYLSYGHREALATLFYGIESDRGFVTLIAEPGLGKTTLTFQLLESFQQTARTVFLFQTKCNSKELFQYLLNGLGIDTDGMELVSMHNKLNQILCREMLAGRRFILAIDEAQNLDPEVLESIRLLSNFETSQAKLIQILLIGQPQLARNLACPELEQLQQRIAVFARLETLSSEDTARYIERRLEVAGYKGDPLFSLAALQLIAEQSQGIPRKINSLCFAALSLGCAMDRRLIDVAIMQEVIADRDVESLQRQPQRPRVTARVTPLPAASEPVFSAYPAKRLRNFGPWALSIASIAACVAVGIGILSLSPARIDQLIQMPSAAGSLIGSKLGSIRGSVDATTNSAPVSSVLNLQAAELRSSGSQQSSDVTAVDAVIVQPGERLRQIIIRTIGEYNADSIEQIRKLNPDIADLDHLQAGQTILFPRVFVPVDSAAAGAGASAAEKNQELSHHE